MLYLYCFPLNTESKCLPFTFFLSAALSLPITPLYPRKTLYLKKRMSGFSMFYILHHVSTQVVGYGLSARYLFIKSISALFNRTFHDISTSTVFLSSLCTQLQISLALNGKAAHSRSISFCSLGTTDIQPIPHKKLEQTLNPSPSNEGLKGAK